MRAALIATGNEIVSGQIINTNASRLADLLSSRGVDVAYHLAVPDDENEIKEAFEFLKSKKIDHVFTIGGLGPTRDDLTRKIIADFFKKEFSFREDLWVDLQKLLSGKIINAREGHKWQCYFPEGSEVLMNSVGTAHGFKTFDEDLSIWCLPGPPEELESVYKNGIEPWLEKNVNAQMELLTWQCIDVPESELAHLVEEALKGCAYEIGYRASPPIVEVKAWIPKESVDKDKWTSKIEKVVKPFLYSKQSEDYLKQTVESLLVESEFTICDQYSSGYLFQSILKSFGGEWPKGLSYTLGNIDLEKARLSFIKKNEKLIVKAQYKNTFFEKEISIDEVKNTRSKRYMFNILVKSIKDLSLWIKSI